MRHRRARKQPEAAKAEEKPFFSKKGAQPDVQAKEDSFFQPKLTIGQPNDKFEQEADHMADAVVNNRAHSVSADTKAVRKKAKLQRQEEEEPQAKLQLQEEEEAQAKLQLQEEEEAQPKLQLQEEEEAQAKLQLQEEEEAQAKLQMQEEEEAAQPKLQRMGEEEEAQAKLQLQEEEEAAQPKLQMQAQNNQASPALAQRLADNKGKGDALPPKVRQKMEGAFDTDFSGVRIHTDQEAVQMNQELGAQAFTRGQDIYFNEGKFDPKGGSGEHLLAHELTHVVQQGKK